MLFITAFTFGLLGSFHCAGMCGPIAFALPLNRSTNYSKYSDILSYNLGRVFTYATMGVVTGLIGNSFHLFGIQQQISVFIGLLFVISALFPLLSNKLGIGKPIYKLQSKVKSSLGNYIKRKGNLALLITGILNGLLPCGLVYMALAASILSKDLISAVLYMAAFGLGTLPLMAIISLSGVNVNGKIRHNMRRLVPVFIFLFGLLFILRGMNLGIPFISPQVDDQKTEVKNCH